MDDKAPRIIMVIDGHDWRYTGDGMYWIDRDHPEWSGTWADLRRRGYTQKQCMTCGFVGKPKAEVAPCNEVWSERHNIPSSSNGNEVYYPKARSKQDG